MRKKSKKKQIVAMTLALSVLSSSVGMCGASAAEALSDTGGSGLQVTVVPLADNTETPVPLADSNADTDTPADDTKTEKQPAASTGDNTDQPTDGDGDATGDNDTSSDDKPTIERPEQSDTVETLPGTAEDNKDHIKGEDKDDSKDDTSEPETPAEGEEKGETPAEGEGTDTEEKPEEKPEEDLDYSVAYDEDTGHFKVTFNIKADAEGDQTIELSKVQEVVNSYGKQQIEDALKDPEVQKQYDDYLYYGMPFDYKLSNGLTFRYYPRTGETSFMEEPSCTTVFDVSLANGSKHTYVYKDSSLTVATPDLSGKGDSGVKGFDNQEITGTHAADDINLSYTTDNEQLTGINVLVDKALESEKVLCHLHVDSNGNIEKDYNEYWDRTVSVPAGTAVVKKGNYYYVVADDGYYYGKISSSYVDTTTNTLKKTCTKAKSQIYTESADGSLVEENYYKIMMRGGDNLKLRATPGDINKALTKYLRSNNTTVEKELLDYYNAQLDTSYTELSQLLIEQPEVSDELHNEGVALNRYVTYYSSNQYDNFYKNLLSFNVGSEEDMKKFLTDASTGSGNSQGHGKWSSDGYNMTIGDYMADKLDENPGAWDKANAYFDQLLQTGMSPNEATWAAFTMAVNLDAKANNSYEETAWNWYASMVLKQADGTLDLTKTDADGNVIGDDEGEGQTSFYLWKYETDKETGEKDTMYCTYVEPTYTTNEDGEQVLEKDGFYCWVKYDPTKDKLTYTVTTTNGKLNIDYALLENVVYYLQEAIAPDGYDIDPEIYIICDEESYKELEGTEVTNPATGATSKVTEHSWLGSILGGKTLSFNFVNTATVPDPEPTPDPDPVPPVDPDIPVDPANPDNPPVQDETPDETPVTPENPQNPAVQDATPDAAALPQTGTTSWMAGVLASLGSLLLACGWLFTRKQYSPKH